MPKFLGTRSKQKATAVERETIALAALQVAGPDDTEKILADLIAARVDKQAVSEIPEDEFTCAWHRSPGKDDGMFQSKGRVIFEITAVLKFNPDTGEQDLEWKDRFTPRYLVACLNCNTTLQLLEHLMED